MKVSIKSSSASAALSAAATAAAQSADFEIVDLAAAAFEVVVDGSTLTSASAALKALVGETSGVSIRRAHRIGTTECWFKRTSQSLRENWRTRQSNLADEVEGSICEIERCNMNVFKCNVDGFT